MPAVARGNGRDTVQSNTGSGGEGCPAPLTTGSSTVFVNGKGIGRIGDQYTSDNTIISGSSNVFAGG